MYDAAAFIQPRIAGSSETCEISTTNSPSPGSATGSSTKSQSDGFGSPEGRAARHTLWFIWLIALPPRIRFRCCCSCRDAAVDDQPRAGHVGALVGCEIHGRVGDLEWSADAPQRDPPDQ